MGDAAVPMGIEDRLIRAGDCAESGDWVHARRQCVEILRDNPRHAAALHILGVVSAGREDWANAERFLLDAISREPETAAWLRDLAAVRIAAEDWQGALDAVARSLEIDPGDVSTLRFHALALSQTDRVEKALAAFDRWSKAQPDAAEAWLGAARCLLKLKRPSAAGARARCALQVAPDSVAARHVLAQSHFSKFEPDHALAHCLEVLRLLPGDRTALALLAVAYYNLGDTNAAASLFQSAGPAELPAGLHAAYLAVLLHHSGSTPELLVREHKEWVNRHGAAPLAEPGFSHAELAGRRMRIAYLCTEPKTSPVFCFFPPLLRNHNRGEFEVSLYCRDSSLAGNTEFAGVQESEFVDVAAWPERRIAEHMRRSGVDILVSFSGHFGGGSLRVSSMRAAPVQVSFPSYPSTTGVPEMDYIFTDRWTCRPGQEVQYTEKPYFVNSGYLVYSPRERVPLVKKLPARRNGYVTFGFFQRPAKLNSRVWDAIAQILSKVENSRLLIHHASADLDIGRSASRLRLVAALESRGVDPARMQFRGLVSRSAHMRLLSTVDVALDSFPYTGQTTTCECLWMGVPVVTLAGPIHVSRASAGILMRIGLEDMVAGDIDEYVRLAGRTASDLDALEALRHGLRQRFRASTVFDGARLAAEVEEAYRWMWRQRAATKGI